MSSSLVEHIKEMFSGWKELLELFLGIGVKFIALYGSNILYVLIIWFVGRLIVNRFSNIITIALNKSKVDATVIYFIVSSIKTGMQLIFFIIFLSYFGFSTTSLAAILGSAGLAIGIALQGILSNLVSGFVILHFRFFKYGDYIKCDDSEGAVENIQIFFTTLKTVDGKIVKVPNSKFTSSTMINFSKNQYRKVTILFQVPYDSNLKLIRVKLQNLAMQLPKVLSDQEVTIHVEKYTPFYIEMALRCYVYTENYWNVLYDLGDTLKDALLELNVELPCCKLCPLNSIVD